MGMSAGDVTVFGGRRFGGCFGAVYPGAGGCAQARRSSGAASQGRNRSRSGPDGGRRRFARRRLGWRWVGRPRGAALKPYRKFSHGVEPRST